MLVCFALLVAPAAAQSPASSAPARAASSIDSAIELASKGRCEDALPLLLKYTPRVTASEIRYRALMATVRCGLHRKEDKTTANALFELKREFPEDPEVLYMTSQVFLEIAERASQELALVAPRSYQAQELQAETFESQGKWKEAAGIYREILEAHPKLRGIHYRLGRAALSQPRSPTSLEDAKKEFELELAIDPVNAAAEFWLGEIARREGKWEEAIPHFAAAAKLDSNFGDALLSLGTSLNSSGRYAEAIPPLEKYVKMAPQAVAGHYQLYVAYSRVGRNEDAAREMALHQEMREKSQARANARSEVPPH